MWFLTILLFVLTCIYFKFQYKKISQVFTSLQQRISQLEYEIENQSVIETTTDNQ